MGTVYFGVMPDGEKVAVKTVRADRAEMSQIHERFDREARLIEMVQGPRVAQLIAAYDPEGHEDPWLAIEYVPGLTLAEYVTERGPLSADMTGALGIGLAEALAAIHRAGVLHRDLKPSNVILGEDGPKVIDFGLAALTDTPGDLSYSGQRIGTPLCMAPEQVDSPRGLTCAADVYALGATLVFALTGHHPYERSTLGAIFHAVTSPSVAPDLTGVPEVMTGPVSAMLAHAAPARPTLEEVNRVLKALVPKDSDALLALARQTYVERNPVPADPPKSRRRPMPDNPHVPGDLVRKIAEDIRTDYARAAAF